MTPATYIAAAFLLALIGTGCLVSLLMDARAENRRLRKREAMLLDDLDYALERADYWHKRAKAPRYREPQWMDATERHIADAMAVVDEPGAEVVELPRRGGGA